MRMFRSFAAIALGALAGLQGAYAATPAAEVLLLTGRGTATNPADGGIRELAKGDAVFAGEVVSSSVNSYVNLKFADGAFILLRPNTRFVIEDYAYAGEHAAAPAPPATPKPAQTVPAPGAKVTLPTQPQPAPPPVVSAPSAGETAGVSRAFFRLLKGGFRAVSGLIGKADRNEYRVSTPVATIGIRGTDYLAVICDAACASDPVLREDLPKGGTAEGGLVAGVITGGIGVADGGSAAGCLDTTRNELKAAKDCKTTELGAGKFLLVTTQGKHVALADMPHFLIVDPLPNPTSICN